MEFIQVVVLAIVQGITEFLPISSSGHLVLVPRVFGWPDQGLAFDVAVHVGTLSAVIGYFRHDIVHMGHAFVAQFTGDGPTPNSRLAWAVIIGTIPVALAGLVFADQIEQYLRSPIIIATTTIVFGLLLWFSDYVGRRARDEYTLTWSDVIVIGMAQVLALIPGTSRSGITMTAGLLLGLTREAAARFSFLLSIPVIALAGGYETWQLLQAPQAVDWLGLFTAVVLSAGSAYLCIRVFLRFIESTGMLPFALYRLLLGAVIFYVVR